LAAQRHALNFYGPDHVKSMEPRRGLISAELELRNYDAALLQQTELERLALKLVGPDPKEWAQLNDGRANILYEAGRYAEGFQSVAGSLSRCEAAQLPRDEYCQRLRIRKMRFALRLGSVEVVDADRTTVEALAADTNVAVQVDALTMLLRLEAARRPIRMATGFFERLEALCESEAARGLDSRVKAVALLAMTEYKILLLLGLGGELPPYVRAVSSLLRGILQSQRKQLGESLASLHVANDAITAALGAEHPMAKLFSIDLAIAMDAVGATPDALRLVNAAEPVLRNSLGDESATFVRVKLLKRNLERRLPSIQPSQGSPGPTRPSESSPAVAVRDFFT